MDEGSSHLLLTGSLLCEQDDIINLRSQQQTSHEGTRNILKQMEVSWGVEDGGRGKDRKPPAPVCHLSGGLP